MRSIKLADKSSYATVQKDGKNFLMTVEELVSFFENSQKEKSNIIEFKTTFDIPKNFTGICVVAETCHIYHMEDGKYHNENGPAVICKNGAKIWYINDLEHREDGPSTEYADGGKDWHYKNKCYGTDDEFTNESWKKKVKELKATDNK